MEALEIFALQLILSIIVYSLLAKWYVVPWLVNKPINQAFNHTAIPSCPTSFRADVSYPGRKCPTAADLFCQRCSIWRYYQRPACNNMYASASRTMANRVPIGLDLQYLRLIL